MYRIGSSWLLLKGNYAVYSLPGGKAMLHCEYCGSELRASARFCGHCGQKISSEIEVTTNSSDAPIEDSTISPLDSSTAFNNLQDSVLENGEEEEQQALDLASENDVADEEQTSLVTQETQSPYASAQKPESRPVSRYLLFFLAGLVVIAGVVAALIGLFHLKIPGIGGSSNALSSSSSNEIIKTTGSSLTASICVKSSTPSTSGTTDGTGITLFASSGCSSVMAATANSSCLIFPYNTGASHKYIFDVSNVAIDSKSYHLVLGVVDYTGPTTYNDARHISVGLSEGSSGRNFSWLYRSGSVTINSDEQSGTMDVILQTVNGGNAIHVVGDWACGRQIKSA